MNLCSFVHLGSCVQVIYEDEHLLAVNKPEGIITAPKHRFMVRRCCHNKSQGIALSAFVSESSRWTDLRQHFVPCAEQGGSLVNRIIGYLGEYPSLDG